MFKWIYLLLLVSSILFVFWKGRFEERVVASALMIGSIVTPILYRHGGSTWLSTNVALIINEAAVTAAILFVAYRSKSFWPLPIAAFQMIALLTPVVNLWGKNLASYALGVTQGLWAYLQLLILVVVIFQSMKAQRAASTN